MNNKLVGTIIISVGTLLLGGILYSFFIGDIFSVDIFGFLRKGGSGTEETVTDENGKETPVPRDVKRVVLEERASGTAAEIDNYNNTPATFNKDELTRMAASFAERFGTYSNQSNYGNIVSLKIFMSDRMKNWADSFIDEHRGNQQDNNIYFGITTKAVAKEMLEYDDDLGRATVLVQTRRREAVSSTNNISNTFGQNITINFIEERGGWKVDKAHWEGE